MEFTISQLFEEFKSNLEITDLQTTTVSVRQGYIRSVIEREMKIRDSFLTGSYTRNTMIAPLQEADIDIFLF
jgi:tRNA nucleotidyltransferase (CCA-adding enzyme)